jgi:G3E family GTPase
MPADAADGAALESRIGAAVDAFGLAGVRVGAGGTIRADGTLHRLDVAHGAGEFVLEVASSGSYVMFCEHAPQEFELRLEGTNPVFERQFASHHHHDEAIGSVGIADPRPLDADKVNAWLSYLLQSRGQDIFRMKGVLNLRGEERRYVFHGVHMMFDGKLERPWNGLPRSNTLVFIGRDLDRQELEAGFSSCVA